MKRLRLNKRLNWLTQAYRWLCDYITNNVISMSFYKTIDEDLERFDEERWHSNNHTGFVA